ncbi:hypothetical protein FQZ97_497130 [compost metagenome]
MGTLLLEHRLNLASRAAVDPLGGPVRFPLLKEGVLLLDRLEAAPLQGGGLRMLDRVLDRALSIRITHARRIGHHAIVGKHGRVHRIELGLVQVGLKDAFLQVVQHHVLGHAAEVTPGLLVQLRPDLLARFPHHAPEAVPGMAQRHYEQPRLAITVSAGHPGWCTLAVVDLRLLPRQELQPVELLRRMLARTPDEALDAFVAGGEAELVYQVLVDGRGVPMQPELSLDEFLV